MLVSTMNCCFSGSFSILFCVELALVVGPLKCRLKGCELESRWPKKGRTKHMFSLDILWPMDHAHGSLIFLVGYQNTFDMFPGSMQVFIPIHPWKTNMTWHLNVQFCFQANSEFQPLFFGIHIIFYISYILFIPDTQCMLFHYMYLKVQLNVGK